VSYDGWLAEGAERYAQAFDGPDDEIFEWRASDATDAELRLMMQCITQDACIP